MMRTFDMLKIAASTLVMGTAIAAGAGAASSSSESVSTRGQNMARVAQAAAENAEKAIAARKGDTAVEWAERAVAAMPQDGKYRLTLGEAYLSAGRFASAEAAFSDALTLAPDQGRAALKLALSKIAMGRGPDAIAVLEANKAKLAVADYGLALALAGDPGAAIAALEPAARGYDANTKIRQNLALSYAIGGRWVEARGIAAQDLHMTAVDKRMREWASFVRPTAAWDQVASLLGVTPVYDDGQPAALALVQSGAAPVQVAVNEDVVEPVAMAPASSEEVVLVAEAAPAETQVAPSQAAPAQAVASNAIVFAPLSEVVQRVPATPEVQKVAQRVAPRKAASAPLIKSSRSPVKQEIVAAKPMVEKRMASATPTTASTENGKFSVQLGAYSTAARADAAWASAAKKSAALAKRDPARGRVSVGKGSLYRLAVSGFTSREDANRVCTQVRSSGGSCFVRSSVGDTNIRFAKRGTGTRLAAKRVAKPRVKIAAR
jgi:Flp pilus assembly protein TadD